jgi:hypothetical protein
MPEGRQSNWLLGALALLAALWVVLGPPGQPGATLSEPAPVAPPAMTRSVDVESASEVALLVQPVERLPAEADPEPVGPRSEVLVQFQVTGFGGRAEATIELSRSDRIPPVRYSTDPDGILELRLEPGDLQVSAWTEDRCSNVVRQTLSASDERRKVLLQLQPCGFVEGRVVTDEGGVPIEGARVSRAVLGATPVRTDGDGWYRLPWPRDSVGHGLECKADGRAEDAATLTFSAGGVWSLERRDPANLSQATGVGVVRVDFQLLPEGTILGRAVGPDGDPLADAEVRVEGHYWRDQHEAIPNGGASTTEQDGTFEVSGLLPDITHQVHIEAAGLATARVMVPPSKSPVRDVGAIALWGEAVISGELTDVSGAAVEGLEMRIEHPAPVCLRVDQPAALCPRDAHARLTASRSERTITIAGGEFRFSGLAGGVYRLAVRSDSRSIHETELRVWRSEQHSERIVLPEGFLGIQGIVLGPEDP